MASRIRTLIYSQVDFPSFLEQEIGLTLVSYEDGKYKGQCPFPYHKDNNPSFSLDRKDGGYVWYCYGCSEGGTIVEFFSKYYGISTIDAIKRICAKFEISDDFDTVIKSMHNVSSGSRKKSAVEQEHLMFCDLCRMFLRNNFEDRKKMREIRDIISQVNEALSKDDVHMLKILRANVSEII